jgi:hypothetical protein
VKRLVALLMALAMAAGARAESPAALGSLDIASDTDGFHVTRMRAGVLYPYGSYLDYVGVAAQNTRYSQSGWSRNVAGVEGLYRKQDAATLAGILAEGGVVEVAGKIRVVGDATWSARPLPDTGVELIAAGDLVDTQTAISRGIAFGFFGASAEQAFLERFTLIGLAGYQPFTDGNDRVHFRARAIWQVLAEYGVTLQARWRQYESSKEDVDRAYFNPDRYRQWQGVVAFRRRYAGWVWSGAIGFGRELVDSGGETSRQPTQLAEFRAEGPIAENVRLVFNALYNKSTGYVDAPDYSYRRFGVTLIYAF